MRKIITLILFINLSLYGQNNVDKLTNELELDKLSFGEKANSELVLESNILENGTFDFKEKLNNKIFKTVRYNFDQNKKLQRAYFEFKNEKIVKKNAEQIFDLLSKIFGNPTSNFEQGIDKDYKFQDSDFEITLSVYNRNLAEYSALAITKINIQIIEKYDEFSKITYILPQNNYIYLRTENDFELGVDFFGSIKNGNKSLLMKISSESSEWKFLDEIIILTSDGETEKFELNKKRDVDNLTGLTNETAIFEIPKSIIDKMEKNDFKFRAIGKRNFDFQLREMQFQTFKTVWNYLKEK